MLAPTPALIAAANRCDDFNDGSYVILYRSAGGRVLFGGDSHDATWEYILTNHADDVRDVDLLIAPHHGRRSGRRYDFLDVVNPALTFFGNADSDHLYQRPKVPTLHGAGIPLITQGFAASWRVGTFGRWY